MNLFVLGYLFCLFSDLVFSVSNFFVQKAFTEREKRRKLNEEREVLK